MVNYNLQLEYEHLQLLHSLPIDFVLDALIVTRRWGHKLCEHIFWVGGDSGVVVVIGGFKLIIVLPKTII